MHEQLGLNVAQLEEFLVSFFILLFGPSMLYSDQYNADVFCILHCRSGDCSCLLFSLSLKNAKCLFQVL